jgi:hypothetical protein
MIVIEWAEVPGAVSYNVFRAAVLAGPYSLIAAAVVGTTYSDSIGTPTDYYKVAGVDKFGLQGSQSDPIQQFTPPANLCKLFGIILDINGDPEENASVELFIDPSDTFQFVQTTGLTEDTFITNTSEVGKFEVYLPIGALARLRIQKMGMELQFSVPNQATLDMKDIVGVVGVRKQIHNPF